MNNNNNQSNNQIVQNTKELFVQNVQKWVLLDSQLKLVNEKIKVIRENKNTISNEIIEFMNNNNISTSKIKISDGELKLYNKKEYSPLTFTYIEKCLAHIIPDKTDVEYILNYLKENRNVKSEIDIRRIYNNNTDI